MKIPERNRVYVEMCDAEFFIPPWVKWLAIDDDGDFYGYRQKPTKGKYSWNPADGDIVRNHVCKIAVIELEESDDWETLIEEVED